ncbi:MAG: hypothetical protein KGS60_07410 [Verrucomicrobia bacterium]|nr:hypothetical protein [Verrucomicrobiota bacterium]
MVSFSVSKNTYQTNSSKQTGIFFLLAAGRRVGGIAPEVFWAGPSGQHRRFSTTQRSSGMKVAFSAAFLGIIQDGSCRSDF